MSWNIEILPDWISAIGTLAATFAAVGIAVYTFRIGQHNKKNEGLRYVFELLDDNGHRNARRRIINLYDEKDEKRQEKILRLMGVKEEDIKRKEAILIESQEIVKADFDEIGSLLKNNEIPQDEFIKIYWRDILKCWQVLQENIKKIQKTIDKNYMENFQKLKDIATEYAKHNMEIKDFTHLVHKDIIVYPELKKSDYNPTLHEISYQSDEILNKETLNDDTIYLRDENDAQITDSRITIEYNDKLRLIIVTIIEKPSNKRCYLFLSTGIKDIYGNPLKEPLLTDHTV